MKLAQSSTFQAHVLVVDDDDRLRHLLRKFLHEQGFAATGAANAQEARRLMAYFIFDALSLDVMMPQESGLDFLASLPDAMRQRVLMLSAMGEAEDRVHGLECGAQDYLVKPFEPKELVLRLRTILRRHADIQVSSVPMIMFGPYAYDSMQQRLVHADLGVISLTSSELALLRCLAAQVNRPVSREALAEAVGGSANERAVDVQVTRLRKKIEDSEGKPLYIQTVRGAGYVLYAKAEMAG